MYELTSRFLNCQQVNAWFPEALAPPGLLTLKGTVGAACPPGPDPVNHSTEESQPGLTLSGIYFNYVFPLANKLYC